MKSMIKQIGIGVALSAALIACGGSSTDTKLSEPTVNKEYTLNPAEAQAIITGYLTVKDALVQTDQAATSAAATVLLSKLPAGNASVSDMLASAEKIASASDVEVQRAQFENLSAQIHSIGIGYWS